MAKSKNYIVYSQVLDCFIRVRKVDFTFVENLFENLDEKIATPGFKMSDFAEFISKSLIANYTALSKKYGEASIFAEAAYEAVTEVYPQLTAETACKHYNIAEAEDEEAKKLVSYDLKKINQVAVEIKKNVIGQDEAITAMVDTFKLMNSGFESFMSLFFIGPTGVGKTEVARQVAEKYFGEPKKLLKINCAEYSNPHEYAKLIGSPPGYIGFNEKGLLSDKAEESSQWVILFDEIEKANTKLHDLLLGLLDEGNITDSHGDTLDFSNSIIIFTSNVGIKGNLGKKSLGFGSSSLAYKDIRGTVEEAFKTEFSPEFINRIDQVVHFNALTKDNVRQITRLNLKKIPVRITKKLVEYVVDNGYSEDYGARNIKRFIKKNITLLIADKILSGDKSKIYKPKFQGKNLSVGGVSSTI
jgi:ATP-dependent Clp protease ATP-binding subunit ClpA